jgi:hypothetical protein
MAGSQVTMGLRGGASRHGPITSTRDSKLTRLVQPWLEGRVHNMMMGVRGGHGASDATMRWWTRSCDGGADAEQGMQSRAEVAEQGRRRFGLRKGDDAVKRK